MRIRNYITIKNIILLIIIFFIFFRFYELSMPDVIEDEDGHIRDVISFYNKDPFIVPRHHTFHHAEGNMGHPFFHHFLMYFAYIIFGPSNFSSRLPAVIMSIVSVFIVYHLSRKMFGDKSALVGSSLFTLSPLVFRVSRTAHIDSTFAAMGGFALYYFYLYLKYRKLTYSLLVGFFCALLFSSKVNGLIIFFIFFMYLFIVKLRGINIITRKDIKKLILSCLVFIAIFFLFNDPSSYLDAIINPADKGYISVFTNPIGLDWNRLQGTLIYLFPWHFTILLIVSSIYFLIQIINRNKYENEYLLLIISLLLFITGFRFGLERGLLIFLIPACILVGNFIARIVNFQIFYHRLLFLLYILLFIPYLVWYGFRTKPLPFYPYDIITHYYDNRLKIFKYLNHLPQDNITVSTLPSTLFFPDLNLRKGIELIPVAFRNPDTTDFFLTDNWEIYQTKLNDNKYELIIFNKYQNDIAALFKRRL